MVHRPWVTGADRVEVLVGAAGTAERIAELPLRAWVEGPDLLALVPYRQVAERGYACHDDGTPLAILRVAEHCVLPVAEVLDALPESGTSLVDGRFEPDDDAYRQIVARVLRDEIGRGEGSNFVIRRAYRARLAGGGAHRAALAAFRRLLIRERGAYWTFLVRIGGRTLLGATPERHVALADGVVAMNPISGTYRYPPGGPSLEGLLRFLADRKEDEELSMVVDEELKMLGRMCDGDVRLSGPELTEMAHLAHTGYTLRGRTAERARQVLLATMAAPTVTGSPLENACRVIARHEPTGRGYYGGALALFERRAGRRTLDAAIAIRTADIGADGSLELGVGATLVRRSDPSAEVAETRAKAAALLATFDPPPDGPRLAAHGAGHEAAGGAGHEAAHGAADGGGHGVRRRAAQDAAHGPGHEAPDGAGHEAADRAGRLAAHGAGLEAPDGAAQDAAHGAGHDAPRGAGHEAAHGAAHGRTAPAAEGAPPAGDTSRPASRSASAAPEPKLAADPRVAAALAARTERLARFWVHGPADRPRCPGLAGRQVLVVDAGDTFTAMLAHQLRAAGPAVTVRRWDQGTCPDPYDAVVVGPGPGDPRRHTEPRIAALRELTRGLLATRTPVLAVCLGHQVLASLLGLPVRRRPEPAQGEQRKINLFGGTHWVGFYNTFAAYALTDELPGGVRVCRDPRTGEVYALRGPSVWSLQFHPESVLTRDGDDILRKVMASLLGRRLTVTRSAAVDA